MKLPLDLSQLVSYAVHDKDEKAKIGWVIEGGRAKHSFNESRFLHIKSHVAISEGTHNLDFRTKKHNIRKYNKAH